MFKSTKDGAKMQGKILPPRTDEDLITIIRLFAEIDEPSLLYKEDGVWKEQRELHRRYV